ncbi:MAG: hypothetical protein DMG60_07155 [Acidobacteria bacterium]|nr:MAG: hypothetical protein DMG60_07155 [Acidobacteriota bacterium]
MLTRVFRLLVAVIVVFLMSGCMSLKGSGGSGTPSPSPGTGNTGGGNGTPAPVPVPVPIPAPTNSTALNHIVFMFQENRSFDHYFAHLNSYRKVKGWGGANDVDTLDALNSPPTNPADADAPLKWNSTNAVSVMINGAPAGSTNGGMKVAPATPTLYTATASSSTGITADASVVVGTTPGRGSGILVGASPMKVAPGGTSMLTWATPDDSSVTISPAPDPLHAQAYGPNASSS